MVIELRRGDLGVQLNAGDGKIINRSESSDQAVEQALATVRVGEPMGDAPPWPYGLVAPTGPREVDYALRSSLPDPASGIIQHPGCGLSVAVSPNANAGEPPPGQNCWVTIENGRSILSLWAGSGKTAQEKIAPEDQDAFSRWAAAVEVVNQ